MEGTLDVATGTKCGPLIIFTDGDGVRHAVRISSVIAMSDLDQTQDATLMQLPGSRAVTLRLPLDQALMWFLDAANQPGGQIRRNAAPGSSPVPDLLPFMSGLLRLLLDEGAVSSSGMMALRTSCLEAGSARRANDEISSRGKEHTSEWDVDALFAAAFTEHGV